VSDERDSADAAGDDGNADTTSGEAVVAARPQRPSGKRSRQRDGAVALAEPEEAESTAEELGVGKGKATNKRPTTKTKKANSGPSRNPFVFVVTYIKQVIAELRKVIWPNRKQMVSYTSVVLVFLAFMVALIGAVDLGLAKLVLLVFG
jgi:preprotein translocase subunit SecE